MSATGKGGQRGGFVLGMIVGLLIGLALALGVALYVSKVPVPFVDKVPQRTAEQDAAEAERNRGWDPNAPLASKAGPPPPPAAVSAVELPGVPASTPVGPRSASVAASAASGVRGAGEPFVYFVQVAALARADEAEQLRAKLALAGLGARVTEREQAGRIVYRVRLGPYERRDDAEQAQAQAVDAGHPDATLVRVNR